MYFDIMVRADERGSPTDKKDWTGQGPFSVTYGSRSSQDFDRLSVPQKLCFWIRARTARFNQGCVSVKWSGPVCGTTASTPPGAPSKPIKKTGKPRPGDTSTGRIIIGVTREPGNVFFVKGFFFQRNAPVTIRAVDAATLQSAFVTSIGGTPITAGAGGQLAVRLYNICSKARGPMMFSANDGRSNPADKSGTLWSNTVRIACQ